MKKPLIIGLALFGGMALAAAPTTVFAQDKAAPAAAAAPASAS